MSQTTQTAARDKAADPLTAPDRAGVLSAGLARGKKGKRIVIKLGTSTLTCGSPRLNRAQMLEIVRAAAKLRSQGHQVLVVTSGAVAAGREVLQDPKLPPVLSSKQLLASVGQGKLIEIWESLFAIYGLHIGQMLLTRADLENRERFLNARDTLFALLDHDIVPVINENDAVSTLKIRVGDNDNMAALIGMLAEAHLIILLTDQKGLYSADPRKDPKAHLIPVVTEITDDILNLAGGSGTSQGTGGMSTKVQAARTAVAAGIELIIASGKDPSLLVELANGRGECTRFLPQRQARQARKLWLSAAVQVSGSLVVDAGAQAALQQRGSSLLPSGLLRAQGKFERGAVVAVVNEKGEAIARGVTRYSAQELNLICGRRSDEIASVLGFSYGAVVIHRDYLVLDD